MDPAALGSVGSLMFSFPMAAYSGITPEQMKILGSTPYYATCSYISTDGLMAIKDETLAEMTNGCFASLDLGTLGSVTGRMLNGMWIRHNFCGESHLTAPFPLVMSDSVISSIAPHQLHFMGDDIFSHLNSSRFTILVNRVPTRTSICGAISPAQFTLIQADAFKAIPGGCVHLLDSWVFVGLSAEQLHHLRSTSCAVLSADQIAFFNVSAFAGMTLDCFRALNSSLLRHLPDQASLYLIPECWSILNMTQISFIPRDAWKFIPAPSFAKISANAILGIAEKDVAIINAAAFAGLSYAHIRKVQLGSGWMSHWTMYQWSYIPAGVFSAFNCSYGFQAISPTAWVMLKQEQFQSFVPEVFKAKSCSKAAFWILAADNNKNLMRWVTAPQMGNADYEFCSQITSAAVAIPLATYANMTLPCADGISASTITALWTVDIIRTFQPEVREFFLNFRCMPGNVVAFMTIEELQSLGPTALACLSPSAIVEMLNAHKDNVTDFLYRTLEA